MFGLPNKTGKLISREIMKKLDEYFREKVGGFVISVETDTPYITFKIEFVMYKYFNVVLNYDRGSFGCSIINGSKFVQLDNSQKWYDEADINLFFKELEQQIELRIPDKFLKYHGWK